MVLLAIDLEFLTGYPITNGKKRNVNMPIEWNENIRTGIPELDQQHQDGIVVMNRLARLKCGEKSFVEAFSELRAFAKTHFKTEEDIMISINYPEYEEHKSTHDNFLEKAETIKKKLCRCENIKDICDEFYDFTLNWILKHYSDDDVKLATYIKKNSQSS